MSPIFAKERIMLTLKGHAVPMSHPEARILLVCNGGRIAPDVAQHYGIVDGCLPKSEKPLVGDGQLNETGPGLDDSGEGRQARVIQGIKGRGVYNAKPKVEAKA